MSNQWTYGLSDRLVRILSTKPPTKIEDLDNWQKGNPKRWLRAFVDVPFPQSKEDVKKLLLDGYEKEFLKLDHFGAGALLELKLWALGNNSSVPEPTEIKAWGCTNINHFHKNKFEAQACIATNLGKGNNTFSSAYKYKIISTAARMRKAGMTYKEMGKLLGVSVTRARDLFMKAERWARNDQIACNLEKSALNALRNEVDES